MKPLLASTDLHKRPLTQRVAHAHPKLWERYLKACEKERSERKTP
jgi:hypothetical protein